jgi:hypothetical protein
MYVSSVLSSSLRTPVFGDTTGERGVCCTGGERGDVKSSCTEGLFCLMMISRDSRNSFGSEARFCGRGELSGEAEADEDSARGERNERGDIVEERFEGDETARSVRGDTRNEAAEGAGSTEVTDT